MFLKIDIRQKEGEPSLRVGTSETRATPSSMFLQSESSGYLGVVPISLDQLIRFARTPGI